MLHEHPNVNQIAVVGAPDEKWGERVKADVVFTDDGAPSAERLQEYVGERPADYKKPREFVFMESLPRNLTGKVLKEPLVNEAG